MSDEAVKTRIDLAGSPRKNKGGAPSKCTPEAIERGCEGVRLGLSRRLIAAAIGIDEAIFYKWMRDGKEGREPYAQFYQQLQEAESDYLKLHLSLIRREAANGNWKASAWLLERRYPLDFGK